MNRRWAALGVVLVLALAVQAEDKAPDDLQPDTADSNLGAGKQGSRYMLTISLSRFIYHLVSRCRAKFATSKNIANKV